MRIAIGADHRGYAHRDALVAGLREAGHEVVDVGGRAPGPTDYPEPAFAVGELVAAGRCERGVLVCGSGTGVCIAANKVPGVRAARCCDPDDARLSRRHNDTNVLCLSGDGLTAERAWEIVRGWLETAFEGGRHARRVARITEYEAGRESGGAAGPRGPRGPQEEGKS